MDFDVVIATRNRPEALALSIPLILGQSRQPEKLIIIDSSDHHEPVAQVVAEATAGWDGTVIVEHSGRGAAYQRNRGLRHVEAEVVLFPDDDSLFHPGVADAMMRAYELDTEHRIAAVCAADATEPPGTIRTDSTYDMTARQKIDARTARLRRRVERVIGAPKPNHYLGALLMARAAPLSWFDAENCVLVEYMTGYRMSFRTEVIRASPFDEVLENYSLSEDVDASFAAARRGLLVGARNARIYHHRFPGGRADPYTYGVIQVLNRSYVALKHVHDARLSPGQADDVRKVVQRFGHALMLMAMTSLHKSAGRERLRGVLAAQRGVRAMLNAPREELACIYKEVEADALARRTQ